MVFAVTGRSCEEKDERSSPSVQPTWGVVKPLQWRMFQPIVAVLGIWEPGEKNCDVTSLANLPPLDSGVWGATLIVGDATSDLVDFFLLTIIPVSRYLTINLFQMVWICLNASQRWIGCFERWWLFPTNQMYFFGCKNSGGMHLGDFRDTNRVKAVFYDVQATHLWPQPWHIFGSEKGQVAIFQKRTAWAWEWEINAHLLGLAPL